MTNATKRLLSEKDIFAEDLCISRVFAAVTGTKTAQDVHRARVLVKKLRARLKLLSAFLPDKDIITRIDNELRTFNQSLSHLRDFEVVSETLQELTQNRHGKKLAKIVLELQGYFRVKIQQEKSQTDSLQHQAEQIIRDLQQLRNIELRHRDVHHYLERELRICCKSGEAALKNEKCTKLHKWRKVIKALLYQYQILEAMDKNRLKYSVLLNKLGKRLGKVHDYCFIRDLIGNIQQETQLNHDTTPLLNLLEKEKRNQLAKARKLQHKMCTAG